MCESPPPLPRVWNKVLVIGSGYVSKPLRHYQLSLTTKFVTQRTPKYHEKRREKPSSRSAGLILSKYWNIIQLVPGGDNP